MATTIINSHQVENFANWKESFDSGTKMRAELGITIKGVFQSAEDPNYVTIISEVPNPDIAKAILSSPELKTAGQKSGVISVPEIKILNQII